MDERDNEIAENMDAEPSAARRGLGRRALRLLRALALGLAASLVSLAVIVAALLSTEVGTRALLRSGLSVYNGLIAGRVEVETIDGALARELELGGVRLSDRDGQLLISAGRVRLNLSMRRLLALEIDPGRVEIDDGLVLLDRDGPKFTDLSPTTQARRRRGPGYGPDFPVDLELELRVRGFTLARVSSRAGGPREPLVVVERLELASRALGREAAVELSAVGAVPAAGDLEVDALELAARWDSPTATLERLRLDSNWAQLELEPIVFDVGELGGELQALEARARESWFESEVPLPSDGSPRARLSAAGTAEGFDLELSAELPGVLTTDAALRVALVPDLDVRLDMTTSARLDRLSPTLEPARVTATSYLELSRDELREGPLALSGYLECVDCDPAGPVFVELDAVGTPSTRTGTAELELRTHDAVMEVYASVVDAARVSLDARVDARDLGGVAELLDTFIEPPQLRGSARALIACDGALDPRDIGCHVVAEGEGIEALDRGQLELTAQLTGSRLTAELADLRAEADDFAAELGDAARFEVDLEGRAVDVEGLELDIERAGGRAARVSLNGRLDPQGASDVRVDVRDLQLELADLVAPQLALRGLADVEVQLQGSATSPRARVALSGRALRLRGQRLGVLDLEASYRNGQARAELELRGGGRERAPLRSLSLRARLPVEVDLEAPRVALGRGRAQGRLEANSLALKRLTKLAGEPLPVALDGTSDLELDLSGELRDPEVTILVSARDLALDEHALGSLTLRADYDDGELSAGLQAAPPGVAAIELSARAPARLRLAPRVDLDWHDEEEHSLTITAEDIDLRRAREWAPKLKIAGLVDATVNARGPVDELQIHAELVGARLKLDRERLGDVRVQADYGERSLEVRLDGTSPLARGVHLTASAPLTIAPTRRALRWRRDDEHDLHLELEGISLAALKPWVTGAPALAGTGSLTLDARGDAHDPTLTLDAGIKGITIAARRVGALELRGRYTPGDAILEASLWRGQRRHAELFARAPISLDPARASLRWDRDGQHALDLELVEIDRALVASVVELPEPSAFIGGLALTGRGHLGDYRVHADLYGRIGTTAARYPISGALDLEEGSQRLTLDVEPPGTQDRDRPVELAAELGVDIAGALAGDFNLWDTPVDVAVKTNEADLRILDVFMPPEIHRVRGQLTTAMRLEGTLGAPVLKGTAKLRDGGVTVVPLRERVRGLELDLDLERREADMCSFTARVGGGSVEGHGNVSFPEGEAGGELETIFKSFPIRQPGIPRMEIDSSIKTEVTLTSARREIAVSVTETQIDGRATNVEAPETITTMRDVVYRAPRAGDPEELTYRAGSSADADEEERAGPLRSLLPEATTPLTLTVALDDPVRLRGTSFDLVWGGSIEATLGERVSTKGRFVSERGTITLLNNEFRIRAGDVHLQEGSGVTPYVDVLATTAVDEVEIQAKVRGPVTRPELTLSSSPAYPESEIFKMLVIGSSDTRAADPARVRAQAASLLSAMSNPSIRNQINDTLRVDTIGISFAEGMTQPVLKVGKHVTDEVYVETRYRANVPAQERSTNDAEVEARYRFAPHWTLETHFGNRASGALELFWSRSFDIEEKEWWIDPPAPASKRETSARPLPAGPVRW